MRAPRLKGRSLLAVVSVGLVNLDDAAARTAAVTKNAFRNDERHAELLKAIGNRATDIVGAPTADAGLVVKLAFSRV